MCFVFALSIAAEKGHAECVKELMRDWNADPNTAGMTALRAARKHPWPDVVAVLRADRRIAFLDACECGGVAEVERSLESAASCVATHGVEALLLAGKAGKWVIVERLLGDARLNPNARARTPGRSGRARRARLETAEEEWRAFFAARGGV
jgi:hypothetical protein